MAAFVLKTAAWTEFPLVVFGCAHPNKHVARQLWLQCIRSDWEHPRIQQLKVEPLAPQAAMYFGESEDACEDFLLDDCTELMIFLGELRFARTAERPMEAYHANLAG